MMKGGFGLLFYWYGRRALLSTPRKLSALLTCRNDLTIDDFANISAKAIYLALLWQTDENPMKYDTSELCDIYHEDVNVVEPLFSNFGGRTSFGGQITTVKCFEDNGLLHELLEENGRGRVLLVDGGGSVRRALVDAALAQLATQNEWEGLVVYGSVRQVDDLEELDIGIQAIAAIPAGAAGEGIGESDVRVNFGGVTFFSGDHLYADNTGIILSEDALDIE